VLSFDQQFLRDDAPRRAAGGEPVVQLAAFGKHPGWDDHIEDIGLTTESLILAKQMLYVQGIGGLIDTGAWEKPAPELVLPEFHHVFVWQRGGHYLLGRLWPSSDGKGRARYPMVACAQVAGLPLEWAVEHVLAEMEQIEQACAATRQASEVRAIFERAGQALRHRMGNFPRLGGEPSAYPATPADKEAFLRVVHQFQEQVAVYQEAARDGAHVKPQQIRVPLALSSPALAFLWWEKFIYLQVPPETPVLSLVPLSLAWLDITIGEPGRDEFFCLKASQKAMPLASAIPYRVEPELERKGAELAAAMARNEKTWRAASVSGRKGGRLSALFSAPSRVLGLWRKP
jgi:hypothetical protein